MGGARSARGGERGHRLGDCGGGVQSHRGVLRPETTRGPLWQLRPQQSRQQGEQRPSVQGGILELWAGQRPLGPVATLQALVQGATEDAATQRPQALTASACPQGVEGGDVDAPPRELEVGGASREGVSEPLHVALQSIADDDASTMRRATEEPPQHLEQLLLANSREVDHEGRVAPRQLEQLHLVVLEAQLSAPVPSPPPWPPLGVHGHDLLALQSPEELGEHLRPVAGHQGQRHIARQGQQGKVGVGRSRAASARCARHGRHRGRGAHAPGEAVLAVRRKGLGDGNAEPRRCRANEVENLSIAGRGGHKAHGAMQPVRDRSAPQGACRAQELQKTPHRLAIALSNGGLQVLRGHILRHLGGLRAATEEDPGDEARAEVAAEARLEEGGERLRIGRRCRCIAPKQLEHQVPLRPEALTRDGAERRAGQAANDAGATRLLRAEEGAKLELGGATLPASPLLKDEVRDLLYGDRPLQVGRRSATDAHPRVAEVRRRSSLLVGVAVGEAAAYVGEAWPVGDLTAPAIIGGAPPSRLLCQQLPGIPTTWHDEPAGVLHPCRLTTAASRREQLAEEKRVVKVAEVLLHLGTNPLPRLGPQGPLLAR
mmetsp:Transcript_56548/g.164013  ORF Transcript_56548/g.164013 Transcript_56548/m.164013 type:complete len:602 (-) Transcript_56548:913-2718(-)